MILKRKQLFMFLYISIVIAMLVMFLYVQKRFGHRPSRKRTQYPAIIYEARAEYTAPDCYFLVRS
ncbi:hypothetical protein LLG96_15365 [bacterium]|nr:hypothetical protein [bacterium]